MASLESRKHVSPDSGFPVTLHPNFSTKIKDWVPPEPPRQELDPGRDRAAYADPEKKALLSAARRVDLTESIGTVLEGIQLSQLSGQQLDELALLVNERSVVFFRDQHLTTEQQVELFEHYGTLDRHPAQKDARHVVIRGSREDHRELLKYTPWPSGDFHADTSFEVNPPSYSMLRMEEHPLVGGDTAWVSAYGLTMRCRRPCVASSTACTRYTPRAYSTIPFSTSGALDRTAPRSILTTRPFVLTPSPGSRRLMSTRAL